MCHCVCCFSFFRSFGVYFAYLLGSDSASTNQCRLPRQPFLLCGSPLFLGVWRVWGSPCVKRLCQKVSIVVSMYLWVHQIQALSSNILPLVLRLVNTCIPYNRVSPQNKAPKSKISEHLSSNCRFWGPSFSNCWKRTDTCHMAHMDAEPARSPGPHRAASRASKVSALLRRPMAWLPRVDRRGLAGHEFSTNGTTLPAGWAHI